LNVRIVTTSVDDFIANLSAGIPFQRRVWYERSSRPMGGKTKHDATHFQVFLQLSSVLEYPDGQSLLVCGVDCGIDRTTADGEEEGTAEQVRLVTRLAEYCSMHDLQLMPGALDQ
jgi:hypothetical protein